MPQGGNDFENLRRSALESCEKAIEIIGSPTEYGPLGDSTSQSVHISTTLPPLAKDEKKSSAFDQFCSAVPTQVIVSRAEGSTSTSGYTVSYNQISDGVLINLECCFSIPMTQPKKNS